MASSEAAAAIAMRWNELKRFNMALELNDALGQQKAACERVLASKQQLIREFSAELKAKDEAYLSTLAEHREDLEEAIKRMNAQYDELREAYAQELSLVEDAFGQEHTQLLAAHKAEIEELFAARTSMETKLVDERLERDRLYQEELDELQARDAEDYAKLKVKLESDVAVLEQQLELMRATYLLNTEKLEYNYRVLTEKDNENELAEAAQKSKQKKLDAALTKVMAEYARTDKEFKAKNAALTREFKRITRQFQDLQAKFAHFEETDAAKFKEVWALHEEELSSMLERLLAADRVITEQILGWEWAAPTHAAVEPPASVRGSAAPSASPAASPTQPSTAAASGRAATLEAGAATDASPRGTAGEAAGAHEDGGAGAGASAAAAATAAATCPPARHVARLQVAFQLLAEEAAFLLDEVALSRIADTPEGPERDAVRTESLLVAMGVENEDEIEKLLLHFFPTDVPMRPTSPVGEGEDSSEAELRAAQAECAILPGNVLPVIMLYVQERAAAAREAAAAADPFSRRSGTASGKRSGTGGSRRGSTACSAATWDTDGEEEDEVARMRRLEREYWGKLTNTVPERTVRVWQALESSLQQYVSVLSDRAKAQADVDRYEEENAQLRGLLEQYLASDVNKELQVPPSQTMVLPPSTAAAMTSTRGATRGGPMPRTAEGKRSHK